DRLALMRRIDRINSLSRSDWPIGDYQWINPAKFDANLVKRLPHRLPGLFTTKVCNRFISESREWRSFVFEAPVCARRRALRDRVHEQLILRHAFHEARPQKRFVGRVFQQAAYKVRHSRQ